MKRSFLILSVLVLAQFAMGQDVKEDFYDAEFFFAQEEYEEALYIFEKVYNRGYQDNANINYRIGICLLEIPGRKTEAIPFLEKAVGSISERYREGSLNEENAPPDALLYLGNAYRINEDLEKACEAYREYQEKYIEDKSDIQRIYAEKQIESCHNASEALQHPVDYTTGDLGQLKEIHRNRYNVVVSDDLKTMAFMGKNPFYNGVYVATKGEGGLWNTPLNITPSIRSDGNMDVVSLSADGKIMLLAVYDEFDSNIYTSEYANDRWNPAKSVGKPINTRYYESHATFSPDGKSIYFASNRKESLGGTDIFRSDLLEDLTWSEPVNLGPTINTPLNEESPFLSPDGSRLYFSSQGHATIGGFDLFYSDLQSDGSWGAPENPGYPLNTTDDDLAFSPKKIGREDTEQVFAKGNASQRDIYFFELIPQEAQPVAVSFDTKIEKAEEEVAEEEVVEKPVEEVAEEPVREEVKPLARRQIRPVFFAFDSYALTETARSKLDDLAALLEQYPEVKLEVIGHTDAIGTFEYNQKLSENRAGAVKQYLVSKGISEDRLKTMGKSESEPVARNRTADNRDAPEGRKFNRRVVFAVTLAEDVIIEMEKIQVPDNLKID
jgi:outer membrane protein OmpA-like peptidoglycan-associated protein/tetratricopeptide (TPR) repeat protein